MAFVHVELTSPDGRPYTARSPRELVTLRARGYRDAAPVEPPTPPAGVHLVPTVLTQPESTEDTGDDDPETD